MNLIATVIIEIGVLLHVVIFSTASSGLINKTAGGEPVLFEFVNAVNTVDCTFIHSLCLRETV